MVKKKRKIATKRRVNIYIESDLYELFAQLAPRRGISTEFEALMKEGLLKKLKKLTHHGFRVGVR